MMGIWFKEDPYQALTSVAYQVLGDADRGFLHRCKCVTAVNGWLPKNPDELGKIFGIRPTSAKKKFAPIQHFFVEVEDLPANLRALVHGLDEDPVKNVGKLVMPSYLVENAEFLTKCKQGKGGGKSNKASATQEKLLSNPDNLDWDDVDWGVEEDKTETQESEADEIHTPRGAEREGESENLVPFGHSQAGKAHPVRINSPAFEEPAPPVDFGDTDPATILGDDLAVFMEVLGVFGPGKVAGLPDARRIKALLTNDIVTGSALIAAAKALRAERSARKFMPKLATWLDEGGHLLQAPEDTTAAPSMAPAHRKKAEEAEAEGWDAYMQDVVNVGDTHE